MLLDLGPASNVQTGLLDAPDSARDVARMQAVDAINHRFGRGAISFSEPTGKRPWKLRADFISRRCTTDWIELLAV